MHGNLVLNEANGRRMAPNFGRFIKERRRSDHLLRALEMHAERKRARGVKNKVAFLCLSLKNITASCVLGFYETKPWIE